MNDLAASDDAQLIQATLDGRSAAFGQLVTKYQDRLYNTLVHVTGNAEDAQDALQEAFVHALVKLDTFRQSSAFYTWLYRIALNAAASARRRKKPMRSIEQGRDADGREPVDPGPGPRGKLEQQERCRRVRQAIAALDEPYRLVLVLREIDGCGYDAIATMLDLPVGTVRSRLHRARLQLRDALREVLSFGE